MNKKDRVIKYIIVTWYFMLKCIRLYNLHRWWTIRTNLINSNIPLDNQWNSTIKKKKFEHYIVKIPMFTLSSTLFQSYNTIYVKCATRMHWNKVRYRLEIFHSLINNGIFGIESVIIHWLRFRDAALFREIV